MPSRRASSSSNIVDAGLKLQRASGQHQSSRFAREKPLSPRAGQRLKFKDKVKDDNPIHTHRPLEFVNSSDKGFVVQTKSNGSQQLPEARKSASPEEDEELIKFMSRVPGFLQRGEKLQDNVLNFGVLDWERLERWTHKQNKFVASEGTKTSGTGRNLTFACGSSTASAVAKDEALARPSDQPSTSHIVSSHRVDSSPVVKPLSGKALNGADIGVTSKSFLDEKREISKEYRPRNRDVVDLKSVKGREKKSDQGVSPVTGTPSSKLSKREHKVSNSSNNEFSTSNGEQPKECMGNYKGLGSSNLDQHCSGNMESIVLLLPKDFSRAGSSEVPQRSSIDGKSSEFNWGSFSDIFSVDEIHSDELFSDISHSCPLPDTAVTETELDLKLDNLIKAQGVELPVNPPDTPLTNENDRKAEISASLKELRDLDRNASRYSTEISKDSTLPQRFSFSIGRMTRSLSFKEGSENPRPRSTYVGSKSGPAKPEAAAACEVPNRKKSNTAAGRTRDSPLRKLLNPLLKPKVGKQMKECPNDWFPDVFHFSRDEKCEPSRVRALLHLTVKSELPLFKFMVETKNEILASTVKSLSTFGKSDSSSSWLYTFYSVHKVKKKSGSWKNQNVKTNGFGYNVVGQMKVCSPRLWGEYKQEDEDQREMVKESVVYGVDLSKADTTTTSELTPRRELAAIVVKMPNVTRKYARGFSFPNDRFSNFEKDGMLGDIAVILPGGVHSLPNDGVPSSLINRWRSGGSCDCGGWDVGCKLRILRNQVPDCKTLISFRSLSMQVRCDLFDEGEAKERGPLFSLVPFRDGLFSVEFDAEISSLQAFSICVAIVNSQNLIGSPSATDQIQLEQEFGWAAKTSLSNVQSEGHEKHAPHPPLSPVGRV